MLDSSMTEIKSQLEHIKILADGALHELDVRPENKFIRGVILQTAVDIAVCADNVRQNVRSET